MPAGLGNLLLTDSLLAESVCCANKLMLDTRLLRGLVNTRHSHLLARFASEIAHSATSFRSSSVNRLRRPKIHPLDGGINPELMALAMA